MVIPVHHLSLILGGDLELKEIYFRSSQVGSFQFSLNQSIISLLSLHQGDFERCGARVGRSSSS